MQEGIAWADAQAAAAAQALVDAAASAATDTGAGVSTGASGAGAVLERSYAVHPREYYEYELVGAVVHTGTADSGHYYSFIKERAQTSRRSDAHGPGAAWFEFNDSDVTHFEERNIPAECFGGVRTSMEYSAAARATVAVVCAVAGWRSPCPRRVTRLCCCAPGVSVGQERVHAGVRAEGSARGA